MANDHLRVYHGREEDSNKAPVLAARRRDPEVVRAPLGEVAVWMADAVHRKRCWLKDFENEEITISRDLYEVIMAYRYYHRSPA